MKHSAPREPQSRLVDFIGPDHASLFRDAPWPESPLFYSGALERIPLANQLTRGSLRDLIGSYSRLRVAYDDRDNRHYMLNRPDPTFAKGLYDRGHTVTLDGVHKSDLLDHHWLLDLLTELGLPRRLDSVSVTGFLSRTQSGVPRHFDATPFIVSQIRGSKRWLVQENLESPNPLYNGGPGWGDYSAEPDHPGQAEPYQWTLHPGDVLYVPAGHWHETSAQDESLSLTFIFQTEPWVNVMIGWLAEALPKRGVWGNAAKDIATVSRMPGLADRLFADLAEVLSDAQARIIARSFNEIQRQSSAHGSHDGTEDG